MPPAPIRCLHAGVALAIITGAFVSGALGTEEQGSCARPVPLVRAALSSPDGRATFQGLGGSPALGLSVAIRLSADGSVIVGHSRDKTIGWDRGTLWRRRGTAILPYPDLPGDDTQWVYGVSDDGEVAVGAVTATNISSLAAMWRACKLVVLGGFPGGTSAEAHDVSADGRIVVGYGLVDANECGRSTCWGSFLWKDAEMTRLRDERGAPLIGQAKSISGDGRVIVGWGTARNEAFRIEDGKLRWLGFAGSATDSRAEAVSADGTVVVGASGEVAFQSSAQGLVRLDAVRDFPRTYAHDVSLYGCRIVGTALPPPPPRDERPRECRDPNLYRVASNEARKRCQALRPPPPRAPVTAEAFLWERGQGTRLLAELLRGEYGIDVGAWRLDEAFGISADGTTIVGDGKSPEGIQEAWMVRLPPPKVCRREP